MVLKGQVDREVKLKDFLQQHWNISGRLLSDLKRNRVIFVNGRRRTVDFRLNPGDEVIVRLDTERNTYESFPYDIEVVYEDEHLLVVNKDARMTVHPTRGSSAGTLLNAISYYQSKNHEDYKIRFAHRLDHDTSGVILIAKNKYAHHQLSDQFVARTVGKTYWALCHGRTPEEFFIEGDMGRTDTFARTMVEEGKYSRTDFSLIEAGENWSLVECRPVTGRTHQIRLHLQEAGYPIIGDELYGLGDGERHLLHARSITIDHPVSGERMTFSGEMKPDMQTVYKKLKSTDPPR